MILKPLQMTDQLRTGVELIDRQHEEFFARANQLLKKCNRTDALNENEINQTLDFIWIYIIEHFATEEELMNNYEYPAVEVHKRAHASFKKRYMSYREQIQKSGIEQDTMKKLMFFMRDWFFRQIVTHDIKMAEFLKSEIKVNTGLKARLQELMSKFFPSA
ncbi:MAG: hypothetical protein A2017_03130 [Lentisphaerae bacterium GWF2_44_16]|nr:MAG: hypothetical protein A2017_03130 [Lentisphaerae bacterium GWF2_44_16]